MGWMLLVPMNPCFWKGFSRKAVFANIVGFQWIVKWFIGSGIFFH
jgi:hypothetical protein